MGDAADDEHGNADQHASDLVRREAVRAARLVTAQRVRDAAEVRDIEADARDLIAVERDRAADRKSFTSSGGDSGYGADLPARRHAALDRRDAKGDRSSAAEDRAVLSEDPDDPEVQEQDGPEQDGPEQDGPAPDGPEQDGPVERRP